MRHGRLMELDSETAVNENSPKDQSTRLSTQSQVESNPYYWSKQTINVRVSYQQ